jgi:hypothetical protein
MQIGRMIGYAYRVTSMLRHRHTLLSQHDGATRTKLETSKDSELHRCLNLFAEIRQMMRTASTTTIRHGWSKTDTRRHS